MVLCGFFLFILIRSSFLSVSEVKPYFHSFLLLLRVNLILSFLFRYWSTVFSKPAFNHVVIFTFLLQLESIPARYENRNCLRYLATEIGTIILYGGLLNRGLKYVLLSKSHLFHCAFRDS